MNEERERERERERKKEQRRMTLCPSVCYPDENHEVDDAVCRDRIIGAPHKGPRRISKIKGERERERERESDGGQRA